MPGERCGNNDFLYLLDLKGTHGPPWAGRSDAMVGGWLWAIVIIGGPILLGLAIFTVARRRRLSRQEFQLAERGARENWGKERIH